MFYEIRGEFDKIKCSLNVHIKCNEYNAITNTHLTCSPTLTPFLFDARVLVGISTTLIYLFRNNAL